MSNPKKAQEFEVLFDRFVEDKTLGHRLEAYLTGGVPNGSKNADYVFPSEKIIVELKTLVKSHVDRETILKHICESLQKHKFPQKYLNDWLSGERELPKKITRSVDKKVQNSIKGAVRSANDQLRSTKQLLPEPYDGILIVANLQEVLFGPLELLQILAEHVLKRQNLCIDAIILITPGVSYSTDGSAPQHYLAPVYRDGKTNLGDFVEPFLEDWIRFEAASHGEKAVIETSSVIDEKSKNARPI